MSMVIDVYGETGFSASWGWTPDWPAYVQAMKMTGGFRWNKASKRWLSDGPEVLLDLERNRTPFVMTNRATQRAELFRERLNKILRMKAAPLPEGQYAYQDVDAEILATMGRGLLGHDRGMGKSKMALTAAKTLGAKMILVLVMFESTLVYNWPDEVEKWTPEWTWAIVPDGKKERLKFWEEARANVWIANSGKVLLADWPLEAQWDYVIVDEIGRAKNPKTVTHKKMRKVAHASKYFCGIGSVMEMKPEDVQAVMDWVRPSVFGDSWRFREQHLMWDSNGKTIGLTPLGSTLLKDRLGPWMIRRDKTLLGLPPVLSSTHYISLNAQERHIYDLLKRDYATWLKLNNKSAGQDNSLTQLIRFQQCVDSLFLLENTTQRGSKWHALIEEIREHEGKVVVFTRFAEMASLLALWLETEFYIIGKAEFGLPQVKKKDRVAVVKAFNDHESDEKVLISTDAGAYGLNITGASMIIHYDQLWNPVKMEQRRDRLHRIGQEGSVTEVNLICRETIDEGMKKVMEQRRELFQDITEGAEEAALRRFTAPSLRRLIEGRL